MSYIYVCMYIHSTVVGLHNPSSTKGAYNINGATAHCYTSFLKYESVLHTGEQAGRRIGGQGRNLTITASHIYSELVYAFHIPE